MQPSNEEIALADRIAAKAASRWRNVEMDDVRSHLRLWLFEHGDVIERYRTTVGGEGKLVIALTREANLFSANEEETKVGRNLRGDNFYTTARLERILPFVFDEWPQSVVSENPVTGQTHARSNPEDYGNAIAILADVSGAFHGLSGSTQQLLRWRYCDDLTLQEIAEKLNISQPGAKKRIGRAMEILSNRLSGEKHR